MKLLIPTKYSKAVASMTLMTREPKTSSKLVRLIVVSTSWIGGLPTSSMSDGM